eukprot:gene6126-7632_t
MATSTINWKSREDFKKQKELEEARKAGTAPAEVDEDGNEINPHIPQYIMKAPWYLNSSAPSLKHQRAFNKKLDYDKDWYRRGATIGEAATKFRKGACTNCGAMTHKAKDCCERPRKVGAKYTNDDIKPDEVLQELDLDYDAKRDAYNGYDPASYKEVMDMYEKADTERKKKKLQELLKAHSSSGNNGAEAPTAEMVEQKLAEEDNYTDENVAPIQKLDSKTRTTIRNLRIREDTAKYLYNLDLGSAFYEPKSHSLRENPLPDTNPNDLVFAGDNFTRNTGDTKSFRDMQRFAWEAYDKGQDVDLSSAPSQARLLHKEFIAKKELLKEQAKNIILTKYGGEEHLKKPEDDNLSVPQSEIYNEYNASGKLIKGVETVIKSKYEEDVYINNHTSIWGSYWEQGIWGYQCCKQTIKNCYCTGEKGRKLKDQKEKEKDVFKVIEKEDTTPEEANEEKVEKKEKKDKDKEKKEKREKKELLKNAIKKQDQFNKTEVETDERKRKYNSMGGNIDQYNVTEEEMEAYNLKKKLTDDPMANYSDQTNDDDDDIDKSRNNRVYPPIQDTPLQNVSLTINLNGGPQQCTTCTQGYTYADSYACSDGRGNWNDSSFPFKDPLPNQQDHLIALRHMVFTFYGNFNSFYGQTVIVLVGNSYASIFQLPKPTEKNTCANCIQSFTPSSFQSFPYGCPGYKYGETNNLFLMVDTNSTEVLCLSRIDVTFFYGQLKYNVTSVTPTHGPSAGGTVVTLTGIGFFQFDPTSLICKFGNLSVPATFVNATTLTCTTPPLNQVEGTSYINVSVQVSEDGGSSFSGANVFYSYYFPNQPNPHPTGFNPLIWIGIGAGIAAFLLSGVGLYYCVKRYRKDGTLTLLPKSQERAPLLSADYKTLFEIKPIEFSEIVIQNRIGRGSCAEVFTGTWRGITVAIKKAKLLTEDDEEFLTELAQEATIMSQLRHPNICQFLGTCNNPPEVLIVMEFMSRGSLYRILHDPSITIDWPRMKNIALDVARGMNYLHCCDPIIIHRDLKSHNLLVDEHFRVKISDFGLSTRFKQHLDKKTAMTPVGTPCWTAPEVLRNDSYTEKADVFSFAIVLWEIVTREDPYQGMPTFQIVISVGQHKLRPILPPNVSAPLTRLITECWSEDPSQRPSFQEIVKRLEAM